MQPATLYHRDSSGITVSGYAPGLYGAKSRKSRRKSASRPNVFQDRCRQPLGYLSAQSNRAFRAYLGTDGSSNFSLVSSKSSSRTRNTKGPLAPDLMEARRGPFKCRTSGTRNIRRSSEDATSGVCSRWRGASSSFRLSVKAPALRASYGRERRLVCPSRGEASINQDMM
jgi:hypothetical protein